MVSASYLMAQLLHREKMPMIMKLCFQPLIGNCTIGRIGDLIDNFSVMTTFVGICTSLGLGTIRSNPGLTLFFTDFQNDDATVLVRKMLLTFESLHFNVVMCMRRQSV